MSTVFTKIINREIPAKIIYEDDICIAFLDVSPLTFGHTLVVLKEQIDHWMDVEDEDLSHIFMISKKIAKYQKNNFDCQRVAVMVIGDEVPHFHIHLIPMESIIEVKFQNDRLPFTDDYVASCLEKYANFKI